MNSIHTRKDSLPVLEIRHLKSLIAIADCGTLSRAASRIHLTQSALSHQLRALEAHYRVRLIERGPRSVTLTRAGERMVAGARAVVEQIHEVERDVARLAHQPSGSMRIALECHTCL